MALVPQLERSGGISVAAIQPPFAKEKKSSPGFTLRSMPERSRPGEWSLTSETAGAVWAAAGPARTRAATKAAREVCFMDAQPTGWTRYVHDEAALRTPHRGGTNQV